jgi:hypothetical protein
MKGFPCFKMNDRIGNGLPDTSVSCGLCLSGQVFWNARRSRKNGAISGRRNAVTDLMRAHWRFPGPSRVALEESNGDGQRWK